MEECIDYRVYKQDRVNWGGRGGSPFPLIVIGVYMNVRNIEFEKSLFVYRTPKVLVSAVFII